MAKSMPLDLPVCLRYIFLRNFLFGNQPEPVSIWQRISVQKSGLLQQQLGNGIA
jgi:hypothetical protein